LLRGGKPLLDLAPLLGKDDGRMREPAVVEARRARFDSASAATLVPTIDFQVTAPRSG